MMSGSRDAKLERRRTKRGRRKRRRRRRDSGVA
jgi:hypothetical protein